MSRLDGVVTVARNAGPSGVTWKEVASTLGLHHGQASGALSRLHRDGMLARLDERRDGSSVYVTYEHINERSIRAPRVRPVNADGDAVAGDPAAVEAAYASGREVGLAEKAAAVEAALATGRAAGLEEADKQWTVGYEAGKGSGYDEGFKAGRDDRNVDELTARYFEGRSVGRKEIVDRSTRVIDEMIRTLRVNRPIHMHTKECWRADPLCALTVARKTLDPVPVRRGA